MNTLEIGKKIFEHHEEIVPEIKHYYGILSIYGFLKIGEADNNKELINKCVKIMKRFPDEINHPKYNFPSYRICGIPRAYALYKGYMTDEKTKALVKEYADEFMSAPRDKKGILKGPWENPRDCIWIDIAMAVTPFLLFAGLALNEERYIDEAVKQTIMMYDEFLNKENGLLHQAKNILAPGVMTSDHWSRGNGWGYIALTELILHLPKEHKDREKIEEYFGRHSYALLLNQSRNGLWRQEIPNESSYEESSGTGLILYGFAAGLQTKCLGRRCFEDSYFAGLQGMVKHFINSDFSIEGCCPGCLAPGNGTAEAYMSKMPVKDDEHAFGPAILALAEAYKYGITEIPFQKG